MHTTLLAALLHRPGKDASLYMPRSSSAPSLSRVYTDANGLPLHSVRPTWTFDLTSKNFLLVGP